MNTTEIPDVTLLVNEWGEVFSSLSEDDFTAKGVEYIVSTKGEDSPWHRAALVLMAVREKIDMHYVKTGPLTVVYATQVWRGTPTVTGADVLTMADNRISWHDSIDIVVAGVLHDLYRGLPLDYLGEDGKMALFREAQQKGEIWLWDDTYMQMYEGVWVFNNPDHAH